MMDAARVRAHIRKHPEAQEGWEELRAELRHFRRWMFPPPRAVILRPIPEIEDTLESIRAFKEGDVRSARAAFEQRTGVRLGSLAMESLRPDFERAEDLGVPHLAKRLLDERRWLLETRAERERRAKAQELLDGWYMFGELRRALDGYEDPTGEVCRALLDEEKRLQPGETLTPRMVEGRVKDDNKPSRESVDSPRRRKRRKEPDAAAHNAALWHRAAPRDERGIPSDHIARLDDPDLPELARFVEDPSSLAPYYAVENKLLSEWLITAARQRLSPREFEVFEMRWHGHKQNDIAAHLGITKGRVSQLLGQVREKLADIA